MAFRTDRVSFAELAPPQVRADGSVLYDGIATRSGVFEYETASGKLRREWRPPEEVRRPESLETLQMAPVVAYEHTPKGQARLRHVGTVGQDVRWDSSLGGVRCSLVVRDDAVNRDIAAKKIEELSCGYDVDIEETSGTTPDGERYDAIQRGMKRADGKRGPIEYEHLAIVPEGRAGSSVRLRADSKRSANPSSWRVDAAPDSARMTTTTPAKTPSGAAAINASAAARGSKGSTAMADEKKKGATRADCEGDMPGGEKPPEAKKDGEGAPAGTPEEQLALLMEENAKLKDELAKMRGERDGAIQKIDASPPEGEGEPKKPDETERMDAAVSREFARRELLTRADAVGAEVEASASVTQIQLAIVEKLGHKPDPAYRTDAKYISGMYSMAASQVDAAHAAEARARSGGYPLPPTPGTRADAAGAQVSAVASAFAAQQARYDARSKVGGSK